MKRSSLTAAIIVVLAFASGVFFHLLYQRWNPGAPQPEEIGVSVREAYDAGAALAHLHARDRNGVQTNSAAVFREINREIRSRCDIIIQNSIAPALGTCKSTVTATAQSN